VSNSKTVSAPQILVCNKPVENIDYISVMQKVRAEFNVGLYSQVFSMLRLAFGKNKLHPGDYFINRLYRPSLTEQDKKEFLSDKTIRTLNERLSPKTLTSHTNLLVDKLMFGQLLQGFGFSVPDTKAVYSKSLRLNSIPTLGTAADIADFITDKKNLPMFAKPVHGSRGLGCISIVSTSPDRTEVRLGDGQQVSARELADEIVANYSKGYLFQELLVQPPEISAIVGKTVSPVRILTVQTENGVKILYSAWKQPKKGGDVDFWTSSGERGYALVDPASGIVTHFHKGVGLERTEEVNSLATGKPLVGFQIPEWESYKSLAIAAHSLFPDHGVLGWDICITARGPVINEVNSSPFHTMYQKATGRGVMNPDIKPLLDEAQDYADRKLAALKAENTVSLKPTLKRQI